MSQNLALREDESEGRTSDASRDDGRYGSANSDFDRAAPDNRFDPTQLLTVFFSRWRMFATVVAICFGTAAAVTFFTEPLYTATSTVVLEAAEATPTAAAMPVDTATVDTEVEVIRSRALAQKVATVVAARHSRPVDEVLPEIEGGLKVTRAGLTSAIKIAFTSPVPSQASELANVYAAQYLVLQRETKAANDLSSGKFLTERLTKLRADVEAANNAIRSYRAAHGLESTPGAAYTATEVSSYNQALAAARASLAEDEARLALARPQLAKGGGISGEEFDSPLLRQLRAKKAELSSRAAQLSDRYGDQHPDLVKARAELSDLDVQIRAELKLVVAGLEAQAQVKRQRAASLQGSLGAARGTLANGNEASLELAELERAAEAARTVYMDFLNRSKQLSAQSGSEEPDARVLSFARTPKSPTSPNVSLNLMLGLVFGIGGGAATVLIAERMQLSLTTGREVESKLGLPFLGTLPALASVAEASHRHLAPADYLVEKPLSSFSEAVRSLRTGMRTLREGRPAKVVLFTSSLPSEGKSNSAVCTARSASQGGAKVLIIDCDLRRRNVNNLLNIEPTKGLLEVLDGSATFEEVIMKDSATGLDILPLAQSTFTPQDVFDTSAMNQVLRDAASKYDLVILDTAPVLAVSDTRILAAKADAVIFLAKWRQTPIHAIEAALKLLDGAGAFIGGVVLTQVDMKRQSRYGYGDQSYYYAKYRKYYHAGT